MTFQTEAKPEATTPEAAEDLVERLVEFTDSPESRNFYRKSIRLLGLGLVEEAMGEVRMRYAEGRVQHKGRYLTTLLKRWMEEQGIPLAPIESFLKDEPDKSSHIQSLLELESKEIPKEETGLEKNMAVPFSKKVIQWARFLNNDFFTLTNAPNKNTWDQVLTRIKVDGQYISVPLVRGKRSPNETARGVLTVEHARILGAIEHLWAQQDFPHTTYEKSGITICFCAASLRQIARLLGIRHFGGSVMKHLERKVFDLDQSGYYLDLRGIPEYAGKGFDGFGFKFMGDVSALSHREGDRQETRFRFVFSEAYSRQLLERKVVSRPPSMLTIRGDIAFKLYQYLYPILSQKGPGDEHSVELHHLIKVLNLPNALWHRYRSRRREVFTRSVKEILDRPTADGRRLSVQIAPGLRDDVLIASLADPA